MCLPLNETPVGTQWMSKTWLSLHSLRLTGTELQNRTEANCLSWRRSLKLGPTVTPALPRWPHHCQERELRRHKEEIRTWNRLDGLDEIQQYLSLFPSWKNFGAEWTSLQLIFSVEWCRNWKKLSSRSKKDEIDIRTVNKNTGTERNFSETQLECRNKYFTFRV